MRRSIGPHTRLKVYTPCVNQGGGSPIHVTTAPSGARAARADGLTKHRRRPTLSSVSLEGRGQAGRTPHHSTVEHLYGVSPGCGARSAIRAERGARARQALLVVRVSAHREPPTTTRPTISFSNGAAIRAGCFGRGEVRFRHGSVHGVGSGSTVTVSPNPAVVCRVWTSSGADPRERPAAVCTLTTSLTTFELAKVR